MSEELRERIEAVLNGMSPLPTRPPVVIEDGDHVIVRGQVDSSYESVEMEEDVHVLVEEDELAVA